MKLPSRSYISHVLTALAAAMVLPMSPRAVSASDRPRPPELYGCPWNTDGLTNLEIGKFAGRMVSYRFRAEQSRPAEKVLVYLIFRKKGYFDGDGGQMCLELQTDDASSGHLPSGKVLASCLISDPMKKWNRAFVFDRPAKLEKGTLYHLVFSNPANDPVHNWTSVDCIYSRRNQPGVQPAAADLDLGVVLKPDAMHPWASHYNATPIYCLSYADGSRQGQGYVDSNSGSGGVPVGGPSKVREAFTVTGADRRVVSMSIRVKRIGSSADLRLRLEQANGDMMEETAIPAANIGSSDAWIQWPFKSPRELKAGQSYHLVLGADGEDAYKAVFIVKGRFGGFDCPNLFNDGEFQSAQDGRTWAARRDADLQFYFKAE